MTPCSAALILNSADLISGRLARLVSTGEASPLPASAASLDAWLSTGVVRSTSASSGRPMRLASPGQRDLGRVAGVDPHDLGVGELELGPKDIVPGHQALVEEGPDVLEVLGHLRGRSRR